MPKKVKYPAYQCFKTRDRTVYCSSTMVTSHSVGREWVGAAMRYYGIQGNDIHGKPFASDSQPSDAVIYPEN